MSEVLLESVDLTKSYGSGHTRVDVLRGTSLSLSQGEFLAITGPSGCGKSTLLHLDTPDSGDILYRGHPLAKMWGGRLDVARNRVFGFVFQFYHLLGEFTAVENVLMPAMIRTGPLGWLAGRHKAREQAERLLERLGLAERLHHRPAQLSGGEQQRVAIARALSGSPEILLCDEPTGNLDEKTSVEIIELLMDLNNEGQTMVVVTHDAGFANLAHRKLEMHEGRVRENSS